MGGQGFKEAVIGSSKIGLQARQRSQLISRAEKGSTMIKIRVDPQCASTVTTNTSRQSTHEGKVKEDRPTPV